MYMFNNQGQRSPAFWGLRDVPLINEGVHAASVASSPMKLATSTLPKLPSAGGPTFALVAPGSQAAQQIAAANVWYKSPWTLLGLAVAVFIGYKLFIK